jgi:hypothetical protein
VRDSIAARRSKGAALRPFQIAISPTLGPRTQTTPRNKWQRTGGRGLDLDGATREEGRELQE